MPIHEIGSHLYVLDNYKSIVAQKNGEKIHPDSPCFYEYFIYVQSIYTSFLTSSSFHVPLVSPKFTTCFSIFIVTYMYIKPIESISQCLYAPMPMADYLELDNLCKVFSIEKTSSLSLSSY